MKKTKRGKPDNHLTTEELLNTVDRMSAPRNPREADEMGLIVYGSRMDPWGDVRPDWSRVGVAKEHGNLRKLADMAMRTILKIRNRGHRSRVFITVASLDRRSTLEGRNLVCTMCGAVSEQAEEKEWLLSPNAERCLCPKCQRPQPGSGR